MSQSKSNSANTPTQTVLRYSKIALRACGPTADEIEFWSSHHDHHKSDAAKTPKTLTRLGPRVHPRSHFTSWSSVSWRAARAILSKLSNEEGVAIVGSVPPYFYKPWYHLSANTKGVTSRRGILTLGASGMFRE